MTTERTLCGRRFNVVNRTTWFPSDFVVVREVDGHSLELKNADETYLVQRSKFEAGLGRNFVEPEPPPPGETGRELTGAEAAAAVQRLMAMKPPEPSLRLALRDVDITRDRQRMVVTFRFGGDRITLRVSRQKYAAALQALQRGLEL